MANFVANTRRRYAMRMPVKLEHEARSGMEGLLIELSQECARVSQLERDACAAGDVIVIETPGGHRHEATVRYAHSGVAGIRFEPALHMPELRDLLDSGRPEPVEDLLHYGT